ncbi:hypothetical protein, partial [Limosilactobacillus fermentum]|uniref:hypothetical protein n=1 Tax=Limosilactobacillus fermentum TaxID=1613 RepID=UPI001C65B08E
IFLIRVKCRCNGIFAPPFFIFSRLIHIVALKGIGHLNNLLFFFRFDFPPVLSYTYGKMIGR